MVARLLHSIIPTFKTNETELWKWKKDLETFKGKQLKIYETGTAKYFKSQKKYFSVCKKIEDCESDIVVLAPLTHEKKYQK